MPGNRKGAGGLSLAGTVATPILERKLVGDFHRDKLERRARRGGVERDIKPNLRSTNKEERKEDSGREQQKHRGSECNLISTWHLRTSTARKREIVQLKGDIKNKGDREKEKTEED